MRQVLLNFTRFGLFIFIALIFTLTSNVGSASSLWFGSDPAIIKSARLIAPGDYNRIRTSKQGFSAGLNCTQKKIARRALGSLSVQYEDSCWISTKIGMLSARGDYLLQPGTQVAGHIGNSLPSQPLLFATPNENVFLEMTPDLASGNGYKLGFRTLDNTPIQRTEHATGSVTLNFTTPASAMPTYTDGDRVTIHSRHVFWSEDAKYMIVIGERGVFYRIDMETFKILTVKVTDYSQILLTASAAISPSGDTAVVAIEKSAAVSDLFIVDLTGCNASESAQVPLLAATCAQKSLKPVLQSKIPGFTTPLLPRFFGEDSIGIFHVAPGTFGNYNQYFIQSAGTQTASNDYLALGDSFSSGEGAGNYIAGTDDIGTNMCHSSRNSYSQVINKQLNLTDFLSVACSGARIEHYWNVKQYDRTPLDKDDEFPGKSPQILRIDENETFTITMSGNDINFDSKLKYCLLLSGDCYNTYEKRKQIAGEIAAQYPRLIELYEDMLNSGDGKRLYVVGYPSFISEASDAKCAVNVQLNTYQRKMAGQLLEFLNDVIESAAKQAGAFYVDTEKALVGHRLCDGPSAGLGVNGITFGNDAGGFGSLRVISNGSFHPNKIGHELWAKQILSLTNDLTAPMPQPQNSPVPDAENYAFLDAPSGGSVLGNLIPNPFAEETLIERGRNLLLEIAEASPFRAFTNYEVWLNSDPIYLGRVKSNGAGAIRAELKIPDMVAPGLHELHIIGPGEDGSNIDMYQYLYVAASKNDFDGDGIPNNDEPCGIIEAANIDEYGDGTDDACDTVIGIKNTEENNVPETELPFNPVGQPPALQESISVTSSPIQSLRTFGSILSNPISNPSQTQPQVLGQNNSPTSDSPLQDTDASNQNPNLSSNASRWYLPVITITLTLILGYSVFNYANKHKKAE